MAEADQGKRITETGKGKEDRHRNRDAKRRIRHREKAGITAAKATQERWEQKGTNGRHRNRSGTLRDDPGGSDREGD